MTGVFGQGRINWKRIGVSGSENSPEPWRTVVIWSRKEHKTVWTGQDDKMQLYLPRETGANLPANDGRSARLLNRRRS